MQPLTGSKHASDGLNGVVCGGFQHRQKLGDFLLFMQGIAHKAMNRMPKLWLLGHGGACKTACKLRNTADRLEREAVILSLSMGYIDYVV